MIEFRLSYADPAVAAFLVIPVCLVCALVWATAVARQQSGRGPRGLTVGAGAIAWMAATWMAAQSGVFRQWERNPPPFALLVVAIVIMEMLSEHTLIGWLEGYLLTGRHGFFHTYEAFAHVIGSMFNQHAKWLDISKNHVPWRAPVASQNILLSSTVWRQDHNGFSHQDPGFIDLVTNKGPSVVRIYLPPDANTLLAVADHCFRNQDCINVIVADKQKHLQFTSMDEAVVHCAKGVGIWARASTDAGEEPDVVLASCLR